MARGQGHVIVVVERVRGAHIIGERVPRLTINGQKATIEKVPRVDHGSWVWIHGFMGWLVPTHTHTHGYPYPQPMWVTHTHVFPYEGEGEGALLLGRGRGRVRVVVFAVSSARGQGRQ